MQNFDFQTTRRVVCAPGSIRQLPALTRELGMTRALVVTDQGIFHSGLYARCTDALRHGDVDFAVEHNVVADPPEAIVLEAVTKARALRIDGLIGFGGGSSMDVAKVIATLVPSQQAIAEIYGIGNVRGSRLPLIQIPTTAGTGSEVTPIAIITTGETTKTGIVSPQLLPDVALLDAELTVGLPADVTAATGIDAMVHAIEAYTSKIKKNPYSDLLAFEALKLLAGNLLRAVKQGDDLEARQAMLYGAMLAGQAFANAPVAAVHALAYPLGGHYHISHGLSNALMLPHVLHFNMPQAAQLYALLCGALPAANGLSPSGEKFAEALTQLISETGIPRTLRELKVPRDNLPMLARDAMLQQRLLINNPREVTEADALRLYEEAWG
ncbi:MAG TPA: iron-containing alcohol dehydrogenase [Turneriella sp.]|nr:iron-containing alcohol dehydrogenase [Turneriella sp.]